MKVKALAAHSAGQELKPFEYDLPSISGDQVDINVATCGICHSDLSMLKNEWGMTTYPFVPGHEVSGTVHAVGPEVKHLKIGQRVGLGWYAGSCLTCKSCVGGDLNLCPTAQGTIVGRHGGFASHVRARSAWVSPLPEGIDPKVVGPLFCGGITVFSPIVEFDVKPTDRVGVIGVGGLGHLAVQFLAKWGCEVIAFSSSPDKAEQVKKLGAHQVVGTRDQAAIEKLSGSIDFLITTINQPLDWDKLLGVLSAKGRLHFVGAVLEPIKVGAFSMITQQKSISGSPLGKPATIAKMLEFCTRHSIAPMVEFFPLSKANEAVAHVEAGKARYRVVLTNDL